MTIETKKNFIINFIYFLLILAIVYIGVKYALGLIAPFLIGFFVAFLLEGIINFISGKLRVSRKVVAVFFVLLFYTVAGLLFSYLGVRVFTELKDMVVKLPQMYSTDIEPIIIRLFDDTQEIIAGFDPLLVESLENMAVSLTQSMNSAISGVSSTVIGAITSAVSFVPGLILSIIITIISSVFIAVDYNKITSAVVCLFPPKVRNLLIEIKGFSVGVGFKYIKAYATLMLITFIELVIGLSILRVDGALSVAVLIAFIDILPVFGTGTIVIPWSIIELVKGNTLFAIGLALLYVIITVVRNVLEPKLLGKQIGLHPLVMLICMYVGVKVFGFIGLFILPVIASIIKYLYDNDKIHFFRQ
jgi:sporulation integral membrane protein YtvI